MGGKGEGLRHGCCIGGGCPCLSALSSVIITKVRYSDGCKAQSSIE